MIPSDYFFENSLLDSHFNYRHYYTDTDQWNELFSELMSIMFADSVDRFEIFTQLLNNMRNNNLTDARKCLSSHHFTSLASDITDVRYTAKFLLSGFIEISSVTDINKIKEYCLSHKRLNIKDRYLLYYKNLIQEVEKISTNQELSLFMEYFKNVLMELVIQMIENYIKRLTFMIQYLQCENLFLVECSEVNKIMSDFKSQVLIKI